MKYQTPRRLRGFNKFFPRGPNFGAHQPAGFQHLITPTLNIIMATKKEFTFDAGTFLLPVQPLSHPGATLCLKDCDRLWQMEKTILLADGFLITTGMSPRVTGPSWISSFHPLCLGIEPLAMNCVYRAVRRW